MNAERTEAQARMDAATAADLRACSAYEREHDEWRAVEAIEVDESDFIPEILPDEVSEVINNLQAKQARLSTDCSGWTMLGED